MPRWCAYQVPVDTGMFTPLGLQPTAVFRLAFNGAGHWLGRNAISHRRLVSEHNTGFVIWSASFIADRPVSFFDADCLEMRVMGRVCGGGTQFACEGEMLGSLGRTARMQACCVPLRLDGDPAFSGVPTRLSHEVMATFLPDEIDALPCRSPVPGLRAAVAREGTVLARHETQFTVHRHQCEVADQWFWPEAASLASGGREDLIRAEADSVPVLKLALGTPVGRLDLLFDRPFFLFDQGAVVSSAHEWSGRLVFIHELIGSEDEQARALAIEQFAADGRAWD
jgi:hypothetical protein